MDDGGDVGDCSTDGSCGDEDSGPIEGQIGIELTPTSLTEETVNALQQFSIGQK